MFEDIDIVGVIVITTLFGIVISKNFVLPYVKGYSEDQIKQMRKRASKNSIFFS
jgi:uncharacterized membrane protein YobD (UPF0266 family)